MIYQFTECISQIDPGRDGELAEFHMIRALGVLNRGTERRGSDEERTPSSSNRARRRTKLGVHGDARMRPVSERLQKRK